MTSRTGRNRHSRPRSADGGFTLIELLLVMLIIAVLVGMAVPLLSRTYSSIKLESLALNMRKLMVYGREKAMSTGTRYRVSFDRDFDRYRLEAEGEAVTGVREFTRLEGKPGRFNYVPEGISVSADRNEILIYPDGTMDPVEIALTDRSGRSYVLEVLEGTGRVHVHEDSHE